MAVAGGGAATPAAVLVVEDDPDARELLATVLEGEGYAVAACAGGAEAVAWLGRRRPALVVLDLALPGLPGEAVARAARRRYGRGLPILVVTGDGAARARTGEAGAPVYLTKPFAIAELVRVVRALVGPEPPFGTFTTEHTPHGRSATGLG